MATVMTMHKDRHEGDGLNHIPGENTFHSLCGWCDIGDWSHPFEGEVTCERCKKAARAVFASCKKSEVK